MDQVVDFDTESSERDNIINLIKEKYGVDNVLNICTFKTEGTRSAILSAARGFGIDNDIAQNIANLIPSARGKTYSLEDCLYGNKEEGIKPAKEFINEISQYDGFREAIESIDGLVSGRSIHASGVIIYPDGYVKQNSMMKSKNGQSITQFSMEDSFQLGGVKYDFLTTVVQDKLRKLKEILLEQGKIQWQGTLRETYDKYFHPDVLVWDNKEMFDLLYNGDVIDAWQFDTIVGSQALQKIKPKNFDELCAGNSLMRLGSSDGVSPLEKYVLHKNDISLWYKEMEEYNLTPDEVKTLEKYVKDTYGMCDTQEILMRLSMDKDISNFSLMEANKLRKGVAKPNKKSQEECKEMFFNKKPEHVSENMMNYVWNVLFKPQMGYAFSKHHVISYTTILIQQMYLVWKYGHIFWKTACLSVNAGLIGEKEATVNYGAVAKAIGDMKDLVLPPCINRSGLGFTPLEKEEKILFGIKPISGLDANVRQIIMENRPYASFKDFLDRIVVTGKISHGKAVLLVKSGLFDSFNPDRVQVMKALVSTIFPLKEKLTMTNYPHIVEITPQHLMQQYELCEMKWLLFGRKKNITKELEEKFLSTLGSEVEYTYNSNGQIEVDKKSFEKKFKKDTKELSEWLKSEEACNHFKLKQMREFWKENCVGSVEKWEMQTNSFYSNKHELDYINVNEIVDIVSFNDLPEKPEVETYRNWGGRRIPIFKLVSIVGTVVDKDKIKGIVSILTSDGVVNLRLNKGSFAHYDSKVVDISGEKKVVLDDSWFKRGEHIIVTGYRREESFVPKVYKNSRFPHTILKLHVKGSDFSIQEEKARV